jgi:FkbM family methyltransferase
MGVKMVMASGGFFLSSLLAGGRKRAGERSYRVLTGPLTGALIACAAGERPSMPLGTYEPHVTAEIERDVAVGDTVFDVGAHVGYLTLVASRRVGPNGRVIAMEADARNARLLRSNIAANHADNVTVVESAVSDEVGTVTFASFSSYSSVGHIQHGDEPDDATLASVPALTIDHLVFEKGFSPPQLIKIDVEGAELLVLRGATQVLKAYSPTVIVEVRRGLTMEPIVSLMGSLRYFGVELKSAGGNADHGVIDMVFKKDHETS